MRFGRTRLPFALGAPPHWAATGGLDHAWMMVTVRVADPAGVWGVSPTGGVHAGVGGLNGGRYVGNMVGQEGFGEARPSPYWVRSVAPGRGATAWPGSGARSRRRRRARRLSQRGTG